jgi:hypothetical protein
VHSGLFLGRSDANQHAEDPEKAHDEYVFLIDFIVLGSSIEM